MLKRILIWIIIFDCAVAQQIITDDNKKSADVSNSSVELTNNPVDITNYSEQSLITDFTNRINKSERIEYQKYKFIKQKLYQKESFDIVSSFGSNVGFGGFWNSHAILNFTPKLDINPVSFLNVRCNFNMTCFVPLKGIQQYYKSMAIQSLAMLAIDNSLKFVLSNKNWILETVGFITKNLLFNFLIKPQIQNSEKSDRPMFHYEHQQYAVTIRF